MNKRVVVGMSGGVDSSVAAMILKNQGYDVIGMTMQVLGEDTPGIAGSGMKEYEDSTAGDAARVAEALNISHYVCDFRDVFREQVEIPFAEEYIRGRTPNPCVMCNRCVKWTSMLQIAAEFGADYVATGHYARIERMANGRYSVRNSVTAVKDQTYMLYGLTQEQLARTLMPVGVYEKSEIRRMAVEAGLPVSGKPDSQEICFIPDNDYAGYIDRTLGDRVPSCGRFKWVDGTDLGPNRGITHYTIGQRKHLGISMGRPIFVTSIDAESGNVVIGEDKDVYGSAFTCRGLNFMAAAPEDLSPGATAEVTAKIRYSHQVSAAKITRTGADELLAEFKEPVRAITPGQAAVFYTGEYVLCGGVIEKKIR